MANLIVHFLAAGDDKLEVIGCECIKRAWEVVEHLIFIIMFVRLWVVVSLARVLSILFPQQVPEDMITSIVDNLSNSFSVDKKAKKQGAIFQSGRRDNNRLVLKNPPKDALGRALSQALELVTVTPASSRKYGFVQGVANTIISDNLVNGTEALLESNRLALKVGFSRTLYLLVQNLERRRLQQQLESSSLLWRMFKAFRIGGPSSPLSSIPFVGSIYNMVHSSSKTMAVACHNSLITPEEEMAEKFVQELLWTAERLATCSAIEDAIIQWSCASHLASLSTYANSRVQYYLMRISIYLLQRMSSARFSAPEEVSFHLLLLWLPFLCNLMSGVEVVNFTSTQRLDAENLLGKSIFKLPRHYQESVLAVWVREFTQSSSDWPNLQNYYDSWCCKTRCMDYRIATADV